jgi:hypothetical protein
MGMGQPSGLEVAVVMAREDLSGSQAATRLDAIDLWRGDARN